MRETAHRAIAIVGVGAILPDAPDVPAFWTNIKDGRYSIRETPADRWDPDLYFDPDPRTPDKSYSKIGGWVRDWEWDPAAWKLPLPPRVSESMDRTQKWAIAATRQALADYGWPGRPLDPERTAVILGNAMAGDRHYMTALRLFFPEYAKELEAAPSFAALPAELREAIEHELHDGIAHSLPEITEDTMPGELANIIAGRVANLFNFHGPNYVVDAACASAMAAMGAAIEGLEEEDYDAVITGGIDANMSPSTFIKFCKIGALSATGTRPYADGADGFVMGEGAAVFLLKRLADAERDGDRIYAVIRGVGGASDGRGKGITAPNPAGQRLAVERAWEHAGLSPATVGLLEGHGTSTRVGDVTEVESLNGVFGRFGLPAASVPLGSVKSNIGHLKGAAGAAGILKAALALHDKVLPPSLNCDRLNPNIDFSQTPFFVNRELRPWKAPEGGVRRAGVSAFGFGGTNFHAVLEEHVPGMIREEGRRKKSSVTVPESASVKVRAPLRGVLVLGAASKADLAERLRAAQAAPAPVPPKVADLNAPLRIAIDYGDASELAAKAEKVLQALEREHTGMWRALRSQGIFLGSGPASKVAFLYTGQGSQYLGMLGDLRQAEPIVAETFEEADRVMEPILGRPLTSFLYPGTDDPATLAKADEELRQTAITQPAVLAVDVALTRLLAAYGIAPDFVMGHSLGEYGALVATGCLSFAEALEAVAARGREMTKVSVADDGKMIAVMAPLEEIERVLASVDGYVVVANVNSTTQAVVGGATAAVEKAAEIFRRAGRDVRPLPVSHAFHTSIVAPASEPLKRMLARLDLRPPRIPIVSNATGELYPMGPDVVPEMIGLLGRQIASPVKFVQGLRTLYSAGARVFVEVGPKRALQGFVEDVLGHEEGVLALFTNHPKGGDMVSLNQALTGLYSAGLGTGSSVSVQPSVPVRAASVPSVVVTGAAIGLPGDHPVFDDGNVRRILRGEQAIDAIPLKLRRAMVDKNITRLVKSDEGGGPRFEVIESPSEVIKLAARAGRLDVAADFGLPEDRLAAFDRTTRLAVGAGLDALRDASIPLVMRYKTTTTGTKLPDRWGLPEEMRDETGVIFASAFPGYDALVGQIEHFHRNRTMRERLADLESLREVAGGNGVSEEIDRRIREIRCDLECDPYTFDRRFLFQVLAMGHSQLAELIGARGPNTQINAACASTTQAFALAQDWIAAGRCRRVLIVAADDITSDNLLGWFGSGFLASGAAATDELVEDAALPFDLRRHGLIVGMGAAAAVVETADAARERGLRPICEVLGTVVANSAFHGSRLDVGHIGQVMETLISQAESRWGIDRREIAPQMLFMSHETYTPARGGSAQAEVDALRRVFGAAADQVVVANTKGFTGHPMAVGVEDVVAVKSLETGLVPPVANIKERDPEFGVLKLSRGGAYPVRYALRLGAGFGSQVSMSLLRWVPSPDGKRRAPDELGYAYRIEDPAAWKAWLTRAAGNTEVEVVNRTLRVVDRGKPQISKPEEKPAVAVAEPPPQPVAIAPPPSPVETVEVRDNVRDEVRDVRDDVQDTVLALIAEKTGYPREMLDLDLDLEADLGIDTVKQAEMFAAIRQAYDIPRDENLKLRDFPTLAHTIQFVYDRRPDLEATAAPAAAPAISTISETERPAPIEAPIAGVPRRVPVPVLRPPLGLCKPTGLTLGPGSRVVVAFDQGGVARALASRLVKLGVEVLPIEAPLAAEELEALLRRWLSSGPIQGVYWLTALDREADLSSMDAAAWREAVRVRVKLLYTALRTLYESIGGPGTFLVSATRLGGRHGYDEAGALAPLGGAVTGLTKSFKREKPGALVKAVDFPAGRQTAALAGALIEETLRDPGAVEIGREGDRRWTVGLAERPMSAMAGHPAIPLNRDTVFVVTGAAGSIVSAIVQDLAAASGGTFHLLDLAPEPDPADPDVERFGSDREGLKRDLFERIKARGERATPALVEKELARIERLDAAATALKAIRAAGGKAVWHRLDLRDTEAVARAMDEVRRTAGRVDVLLHAAGLEISRLLPDKQPAEYDLVFDVKADGWFNLMSAMSAMSAGGGMPLGAAVVFSSIAGRFGNGGQADYSAANDLLCKQVSGLRRTRPETLGLALDWTAWGGIGMATRGSIPKVMEAAGIDMLPPETGISWSRRELTSGGSGEVVVAGRLGIMTEEFDSSGGLDTSAALKPTGKPTGVMIGKVTGMGLYSGLTIETTLDPAEQPFLDDHRIDGTPVLPGVMGIEGFAEAAALLFPELRVAAVEDVEFLAPFKFYRGEPRTFTIEVLFPLEGEDVVAEARLVGRRTLPGQTEPQETVHFKARVRLAPEVPVADREAPLPVAADGNAVGAADIYRVYFHGPAYQVMDSAWRDGDGVAGRFAGALPPDHNPQELPTLMEPRLIELCFQTAGIGELGTSGRMALPLRVDRVTTLRPVNGGSGGGVPLFAVTRPETFGNGAVDAYVVDGEGHLYLSLSGYRTVELPGGLEADRIAPLQAAMAGTP